MTASLQHQILENLVPAELRTDPVRQEPMIKIRVNVRPRATTICGQRVKHGEHEITIYKSDLSKVQALVERDKDALARTKKSYESARDSWVAGMLKNVPEEAHDLERPKLMRKYYAQAPNGKIAPESYFQDLMGRCVLPLVDEPVIVEDDLPHPKTADEKYHDAVATQNVAQMQALGNAIGDRIASSLAAAIERIAPAQSQGGQRK